jgi:uncharacterized protein YciI
MHYLLFYEYVDDVLERRPPFRKAHLTAAWESHDRGELVLGGAYANPVDGALFLFKADSPAVAEEFAKTDPYVTGGIVKRWTVREWSTVAGSGSAKPLRPQEL